MADPVVGITNGVPTSGTGTITTLGQTLLDGANATHGVTTGAAVTTDAAGTLQQYLRGLVKLWTSATFKAASTAPTATDPALVVAISPNSVNANGSTADSGSAPVAFSTEGKAQLGSVTETAPASDTASSGINGRLQRIAQRITSMIALLPAALGANGGLKIEGVASGTVVPTKEAKSATGTQSSVAGSATSVTVLASNANRLGASVYNDSSVVLYLLLVTGGTASTTANTVQMAANSYYETPSGYTGALIGLWASATGNARVTEFT